MVIEVLNLIPIVDIENTTGFVVSIAIVIKMYTYTYVRTYTCKYMLNIYTVRERAHYVIKGNCQVK